MAAVPEITPTEFLARWPDFGSGTATLLDVREPQEHAAASVQGTTDMPMATVPGRLAELDHDKPLVVMCHGGARSMRVAQYLVGQGFGAVFNLKGGIEAWARELGTSAPMAKTGNP